MHSQLANPNPLGPLSLPQTHADTQSLEPITPPVPSGGGAFAVIELLLSLLDPKILLSTNFLLLKLLRRLLSKISLVLAPPLFPQSMYGLLKMTEASTKEDCYLMWRFVLKPELHLI